MLIYPGQGGFKAEVEACCAVGQGRAPLTCGIKGTCHIVLIPVHRASTSRHCPTAETGEGLTCSSGLQAWRQCPVSRGQSRGGSGGSRLLLRDINKRERSCGGRARVAAPTFPRRGSRRCGFPKDPLATAKGSQGSWRHQPPTPARSQCGPWDAGSPKTVPDIVVPLALPPVPRGPSSSPVTVPTSHRPRGLALLGKGTCC